MHSKLHLTVLYHKDNVNSNHDDNSDNENNNSRIM